MNLSEPFIRRPVMTVLMMAALFIFGIIGYLQLPISDLPDVDFPTITIKATLPGASPETMASSIATPLERQLSTIAGVDSMNSSSSLGNTQITLQFDLDRDIDAAAQDVQSAISAATRSLPEDMPSPPTYKKVNPADAPILYLGLSSPTLPLSTIDKYAETILAQRISMVSGVAQVNVYGSQRYAVRAELNPNLLNARNLALDEVVAAIQNANVNMATGNLVGRYQSMPIGLDGQLQSAAAYRPLIVAYRGGNPIRLQELGDVVDSVENDQVAGWYNNTRAIVLAIDRQPGTNTIQVVNDIFKILPSFQAQLPAAIALNTIYDRSITIRASVNEVQKSLVIAAVLVVLVIFAFLRNISAALIASIALPFSIVGTFGIMSLLHFSLDTISLMALTLTVGFVVDDAIVVLENIARYVEQGMSPLKAALEGSKQISFTVLSMTLSLVAVFIPILLMGGIIGRLFHEFAVTTTVAIVISGIIALTLTPMLCAYFLKTPHQLKHYAWYDKAEEIFQKTLKLYDQTLLWVLDHRPFMMKIFGLSVLLTIVLFFMVPKGLLPDQDIGQLVGYTEADPSISFASLAAKQKMVADIIRQDPNVEGVMSSAGVGGASSTSNNGKLFIRLKSLNERKDRSDVVIQELRKKVNKIPGLTVYLQNLQAIPIGGKTSKSSFQYTLQDTDLNELQTWTEKFRQQIARLSSVQDVTDDLQMASPQVQIKVNRDKASSLGVSMGAIQKTLGAAYGTQQASTIYTSLDDYEVIAEVAPKYRKDPRALEQLYVRASNGNLIPLSTVASFTLGNEPLTVNHQDQIPAATISFNLRPGYSLGDAVNQINAVKKQLNPPVSLIADFQGNAKVFKSSQKGMGLLIALAIFVIYVILGILYESFIHPLTILSGLPAAAVGALSILFLFGIDLSLYAFIGIIMLIGIVKKNAIMMIDFAIEAQRQEKKTPLEAIYSACLIRFRPIMMTTLAGLFGTLPIAFSTGYGAEMRRPLGLVVVGGLLVSQLLTLYITPVIYLYFEDLLKKRRNVFAQDQEEAMAK